MASIEEIYAEGLEAGFRARGFEPTGRDLGVVVSVSAREAAGVSAVAASSRNEIMQNMRRREEFVCLVKHRVESAIEAASA